MKILTKFSLITLFLTSIVSAQSGFLPVANISSLKGEAKANKEEKLKVGDEVYEGQSLKLFSPKDFVEIKFQNGHILRLVGGSLDVRELNPKTVKLFLESGKIIADLKKFTPNEAVELQVKNALVETFGESLIEVESKSNQRIWVKNGKARVHSLNQVLQLRAGEELQIDKDRVLNLVKKRK